MQIINQATGLADVRSLAPHPANPNIGDTDAIARSIDENGFYGTVIVQRSTGHILVGHHRYKAAVEMGAVELPVTYVDVDDQRALRIMLADNRTAELAHRDEQLLADLLSELSITDPTLSGTGYDADFLDQLINSIAGTGDQKPEEDGDEGVEPDEADRLQEKWKVQRGDLYQIGAHRLLCGDATSSSDLDRVMEGRKADLVWTDPPYELDMAWLRGLEPHCDKQWLIMGSDKQSAELITMYPQQFDRFYVLHFRQFSWNMNVYIPIQTHTLTSRVKFSNVKNYHLGGLHSCEEVSTRLDTEASNLHKHAKRPDYVIKLIEGHSVEGDTVLDVFCGAGTSLICCEKTKRVGRGIELEPRYVSVTLERMAEMGLEIKKL